MDWIKILVTLLTAFSGWLLVNRLNSRREINSKRRELVLIHLIDSYRILTQEIGHRETTENSMTKFENLLTDIQLFGSPKEVQLARDISDETSKTGVSKIDPLIEEMRSHLRAELNLQQLDNPKTIWFRFNRRTQKSDPPNAFGAGEL